jgi:tol-pal system protein YbgF
MNAMYLRSLAVGVITAVVTPFAYGQIPIDESVGEGSSPIQEQSNTSIANTNQSGQMFLQMQQLQEEVQMLRGVVEEQSALIARLEQQRFDDFVSIDQRLTALEAGSSGVVLSNSPAESGQSVEAQVDIDTGVKNTQLPVDETEAKAEYDRARERLMARQFDVAVEQFDAFVATYPNSRYTANAYYWLGEIAIQQSDLQSARQHFTSVINFFPDHAKALDAKYKLGVIYYQLGQSDQSRSYFEQASQGTGNTARLARAKLEEYF